MTARGLAPLLGLVAACASAENYDDPSGPRYADDFSVRAPAASARFTVASFNVQYAARPEAAADELATHPVLARADVYLLQEMDAPATELIARKLEAAYVYYPASRAQGTDFGNTVVSRWPIVEDKKLILPFVDPTNGRHRIAVLATVATDRGDVRVGSIHNATPTVGPAGRIAQARAVLDHLDAAPRAVIGGDYNTGDFDSWGATIDLHEAADFTYVSADASPSAPDTPIGDATLDLLFARGFDYVSSGTAPTDASDHQPIWTVLAWPAD